MTKSNGGAVRQGTRGSGRITAALAALGAFVTGGLWLWGAGSEPLGATSHLRADTDVDGLPNLLELGIALSPDNPDSDGDGFGDGEEFARGSAPNLGMSVPRPKDATLGMGAYMQGSDLRGMAAVYVADGVLANASLAVGFVAGGRPRLLPSGTYLDGMKVVEHLVGGGPGKAVFFDLPLSLAALKQAPNGQMAYFALVYRGNEVVASAAIHLTFRSGAVLQLFDLANPTGAEPGEILPVVQRPIGGSVLPDGWIPGALCFQEVEVVGFVGPLIKQEVVSAMCQDGWDGYCDPLGCDASVGSTLEVLDPGVLIGDRSGPPPPPGGRGPAGGLLAAAARAHPEGTPNALAAS